jgi:hypothetical protein
MDLQKAFDTLVEKLKLFGITGSGIKWFVSYLEKRYQITLNQKYN